MKRLHLLNCFAATLLFSGCMGYRLGGSRPEGIETIAMAPVINATTEPAIELQVTHAMRQRIQFDGRMKLVNQLQDADAIIEIRLTQYSLNPIAFRTEDNLRTTPELYRIRMDGVAELKSTKDGKVLATSQTYGETIFEFASDLTSGKRDALPAAAQELCRFMLDDLIDAW